MADAVSHLVETATYCKSNDEKRPGLVGLPDFTTQQVCPETLSEGADPVTNAYPDGWYVRIMFDELLDPNVEELVEIIDEETGEGTDTFTGTIANTQPVTLRCMGMGGTMVNVAYDGYYSPSGNRITWPLGPSLVIKPNDPTLIATNTPCEITIKESVVDKSGNAVPSDQLGPYTFRIAPIEVLATDPSDDPDGESPVTGTQIWFDNIYVQFNTTIDQSSLCDEGTAMDECEFDFSPQLGYCMQGTTTTRRRDGNAPIPCHVGGDPCPTSGDTCRAFDPYFYDLVSSGLSDAELFFGPTPPAKSETAYVFSFKEGSKIKDRCGRETTFGAPGSATGLEVHFTTDVFEYGTANIATGETSSPLKKPKLTFTNIPRGGDNPGGTVFEAATLDPAQWTLSPMPFDNDGTTALTNAEMQVVPQDFSGQIFLQGNYKTGTMYTFTLKQGAVVKDAWGATYMQAADKTISWTTQSAISLSATSPANDGTQTIDVGDPAFVAFVFNQNMDPASIAASEFTLTDSNGAAVTVSGVGVAAGCDLLETSCALAVIKLPANATSYALPAGDYTFTLKAGATIEDIFGAVYTQAADRVVRFTIEHATASTPIQCL